MPTVQDDGSLVIAVNTSRKPVGMKKSFPYNAVGIELQAHTFAKN